MPCQWRVLGDQSVGSKVNVEHGLLWVLVQAGLQLKPTQHHVILWLVQTTHRVRTQKVIVVW